MAEQSIVIFGAGKIGRSFMGQIFGRNGYQVIFVDKDKSLAKALNREGCYTVVSRGTETEESMLIDRVSAYHVEQRDEVIKAVCEADIMAISVGKTSLHAIAPLLAEGLIAREAEDPGWKLDIILAENMRSADLYVKTELQKYLPPDYPLESKVGLVETSIGKMAPILSEQELREDPLRVVSEPYNTLILDKNGFIGRIPDIPEFSLKENMKAWVDRKTFIHNLGHAAAAYKGYLLFPENTYIHEVLDRVEVLAFTRKVMEESASILMASYPGEFSTEYLSTHIEDLLERFRNPNLRDSVYRVGSDLQRKLGSDDRFMAIIRKAREHNVSFDLVLEAMAMGFHFKAAGENKQMFPGDLEFHTRVREDLDLVLREVCGFDEKEDAGLIAQLKQIIEKYN